MDEYFAKAQRIVSNGRFVQKSTDSEVAAPPILVAEKNGKKTVIRWWNDDFYMESSKFIKATTRAPEGHIFTWNHPLKTEHDLLVIGEMPCWWLPARKDIVTKAFVNEIWRMMVGDLVDVLSREQIIALTRIDNQKEYISTVSRLIRQNHAKLRKQLNFFGCSSYD